MAGYKDSEARAEDNLSSAWTLVIVGGIGLIVSSAIRRFS